MNEKYEAVIGLEIHAELNTKTKMFCRCKNDPFASEPNTNICPVCAGLPGALPIANKQAVEASVMVGLALGCTIASHSKWDRKNYFYPDLPKGYQISQYDLPLCQAGELDISFLTGHREEAEGRHGDLNERLPHSPTDATSLAMTEGKVIHITRIHLEEDTGTLQHPEGVAYSLVNYNRSGVPLLELVTEPDIRSGKEARLFAEEYQRILRSLGVGNADMEKGEMRVEVNISLREADSDTYGTKVEIKNLNSFRSVEKSIEFEIKRQAELLEKGEKIVQETRGWHDAKQVTFSQRTKEEAADYRYFPEPDLPPLELSPEMIEGIQSKMPALPAEKRKYYQELGLTLADAEVFIDNQAMAMYFEAVRKEDILAKLIADWVINIVPDMTVSAEQLAELLTILQVGDISATVAKGVLADMKTSGKNAKQIIEEKGLKQISDTGSIETIVGQVLAANPGPVADYRAGKQQAFGFLVGAVMREAKGQANPQVLTEILKKKLDL